MKVYLFNPDDGLFAGEDYCDPREVDESEGMTLQPPPARIPGTVPVYDRTSSCWRTVRREAVNGAGRG